jgi:alkylhydroperoxidase/carboxymuconolactone decarboxylase family protein YurZ
MGRTQMKAKRNETTRKSASAGSAPLDKLAEWDGDWAAKFRKMSANPWTNGVLPIKTIELICIALNAACTNLQPESTRRHMRSALMAGATRDEILTVLKCASLLAIHSCSLGAPILIEEANAAGVKPAGAGKGEPTPFCDQMRSIGQWNAAWDPFFALDPVWTDAFFATGVGVYQSGVLSAKEIELLSVAFDASFTHMYAPGTRRHIKGALAAGATVEEIMEVLKLCVAAGAEAFSLAIPILAEELERFERKPKASTTEKQ